MEILRHVVSTYQSPSRQRAWKKILKIYALYGLNRHIKVKEIVGCDRCLTSEQKKLATELFSSKTKSKACKVRQAIKSNLRNQIKRVV